jgi:hypothetical protein
VAPEADSPKNAPAKGNRRDTARPGAKDGKDGAPGMSKKAPKTRKSEQKGDSARDGSKAAAILDLLNRPGGATAAELQKATGWQPHSVRGFLSGTIRKKMGLEVISVKSEDGERTYSIKA